MRRGYTVSVGSYRSKEIDFVAWRGDSPEFYQVVPRLDDQKVLSRRLDSFRRLDPDSRKILMTLDCDQCDVPDDIELVNVVDWLLDVGLDA